MAKQVVKLGLEFDTKAAIASYRDLISEMSKGGADPKAIRQFTTAVEKAETELAQLAAEGSTGFTDSKGIEQYQKKVLKTVTSMQQLALRMQEFNKSGDNFPTSEVKKLETEIEKLKKKITDAQKAAKEGLVKSLTNNGGFTKKEAETIAETVKTQNELIAKLEEEKKLRDEIRKAAEEPAKKAKTSIQDKAIAKTTSGSEVVMEAVGMKGKKGVIDARKAVAEAIQQGIRDGWSAEDVKKRAIEALQASNLSDSVKKSIIQGLEAGFDTETVRKYLDAVEKKIAANPAVKKYNAANDNYGKIANGSLENYSQFITNSEAAAKAQQELADAQSKVNQTATNSAASQKKISDAAGQVAGKAEQAADSFMQMSDAQKNSIKSTEQLEGGFNRLADRLKYMFGFTAMFNRLRQVIRSTFQDMQELDKAYASIAYVTNETVADLWSTYGDYANMAEKLGQSTADVIKASAIYRQQGLDTAQALELTTDTMKLATIAGNDYSIATQEMTAALRGFKMEMDEGGHVSDVYSELAAHAAASVDDIAQAMSRTASIANSAGMSFENTSAFLTQMIETTQESAENIGTSMKTIIARFTELKENIAGTADSEFDDLDFNKVDKALKTVGVALKDTTGQFRNLDDVFLELSGKWASLDRNTQRYIATVAAGSRQQSRFIALMDNYDRTIELINTAADSEGKADEQFSKAADTFEFKLNAIKTKWEEFKLSIMDSDFVKGLLDTVNSIMDRLKNVKMPQIAIFSTFAILAAKNFILNFINTLKTTAKAWQEIGAKIGDKISSGLKKKSIKIKIETELEILKDQEKKLTEKLISIQNMNDKYKKILLTVDLENPYLFDQIQQEYEKTMTIQEAEKATLDLVNEALGTQYTTANEAAAALEEHRQAVEQDRDALINVEAQYQQNQARQKQLNLEQQRSQAIGQALTQTVHSLVAAFSAMAAGTMKSSEAAKTFGISSVTAMSNIAVSVISTTIATQGLTTSFGALAAAIWSALWPILAIAAAVGGIAAIWYGFANSAEKAEEAINLNKQLEKSEKRLADAKKEASEKKDEIKDLESEKKEITNIIDEYQQLHKQKIKTTEESERERTLAEEIRDKYPEITNGVIDENGTIEITNSLLDEKLKKMDEEIEKQKELLRLKNIEADNRQADTDYYNAVKELQGIFGDDLKYDTTDGTISAGSILSGSAQYDKDSIYFSSAAEQFADKIGYEYNPYDDANVEKLLRALNYATGSATEAGDDWTDEQKKAIEGIKEEIINIRKENKNYDEHFQEAKDYLDSINSEMPEWEKAVRAGFTAKDVGIKSLEQMKQEGIISPDLEIDNVSNLQYEFNRINKEGFAIDENDLSNEEKKELDQMKKNYTEIWDKVTDGWNTDDDYYDVLKGIQSKEAKDMFESWFPTEEDYKQFTAEGGMSDEDFTEEILRKYYDDLSNWMIKKNTGKEADDKLISKMGAVQALAGEGGTESLDEALKTVQELNTEIDRYANDPEYQNTLRNLIPDGYQLQNLEDLKNNLPQIFATLPEDLSVNTALALQEAYNKWGDNIGGKDYLNSVLQMLQENKIPEDQWYEWLNLDWTKVTNQEQFDKFKEEQIKRFKEAGYDDAEAMFNEMQEYAKKNGLLTISIETDSDYEKFIDSLDAAQEKVKSLGDAIISVTKDMRSNGEIGYSTFEKLKKSIEGIDGVDIYDYVSIDDNGKITANEGQLNKLYEAQIKAKKEKIDQAKQEEQLAIDQLVIQRDILNRQLESARNSDQIILSYNDANEALIPQVENWMQIVSLMDKAAGGSGDLGDFKASESRKIKVNIDNREAIIKQLEAEIKGIDAQIDLRQKTINKLDNDSKHIEQETQAQYREYQHQIAEASAATSDLTKKQEDLAKAQQDVVDKQKALNEAITDYNKLLYGSDNRKSTLDPLYNYQQAISYLNDEISRTKEILEDSKGFDEASENLNKYLSAAHYQLVQYQAENKVLEEGLAIRRNNLLNGSVSYQGINVKFGDYVKIDEKTGLASIDQQLIQNAKIADKWKDQIESFVDDYNKYSQELLKNQDAVRKAEKEIQQLRMDATKKWADFEKSIAETLKNEYQEEVNALKEKYDSMKDADDDYINALEEAINKQRKLRDRENQLEQLTQKEKKLSLLRRDTSGANALATKKLEKEIEQDREKMLDDKIDDVIENIQKLSEKQDELRQAEIELKEALLDDALYWNMTAETVAQSFTSVDEFLSWSVKHNKEYLEMTEQQRQEFLDSETEKFNESIGAMAILTRDKIDSIENQIEVTAEEINTTVQNTGEVFTTEVSRAINETSAELNKEITNAQNKIQSAIQALVDANEKLREASQKVDEIAAKLAGLSYSGGSYTAPAADVTYPSFIDYGNTSANYAEQVGTGQTVGQHEIDLREREKAQKVFSNNQAYYRDTKETVPVNTFGITNLSVLEEFAQWIYDNYLWSRGRVLLDKEHLKIDFYNKNGVPSDPSYMYNPNLKIYKNGGLVDYTGPAWVDGTSNSPEAFLSAEDTERIGNAAKLLSNIPALNHSNISTTNSSYGDTNIEINLNIDHVSSDVDIEEMLDRVKQEIVDIARPTGTNVILHQQI